MIDNKTELSDRIKGVEMFLLDLDGTTSIENELLPGAREFIDRLIELKKDYVFLTNNSSKSADEHLVRLNVLTIPATLDNVFTSGQATSLYLRTVKKNAKIFLLGTRSLREEFRGYGFDITEDEKGEVDFVVVGFDTELEYGRLEKACYLISNGVPFFATHPDLVCPLKNKRYIPDCGSICQMIENATGKKPTHFGKPDKKMVEILSSKKGVGLEGMAMIGDRLYTDIALGINAGITTICVLSGESTCEDVVESPFKPDFVVDSIADLVGCL